MSCQDHQTSGSGGFYYERVRSFDFRHFRYHGSTKVDRTRSGLVSCDIYTNFVKLEAPMCHAKIIRLLVLEVFTMSEFDHSTLDTTARLKLIELALA